MTEPTTYSLTVNDRRVDVQADDDTTLLHVLRHDLGLAGPRFGCGVGLCGACLVLLDGNAAPACDTPMWAAAGKDHIIRVRAAAAPPLGAAAAN